MNTVIIILLVIIAISTFVSWIMGRNKQVEKPVRVMLFVLYFWLLVFVQLTVLGTLYYFGVLDALFQSMGF